MPMNQQQTGSSVLDLTSCEVDSFSSLLSYLLAHKCGLDIETLASIKHCTHKIVDPTLQRQLHQWALRQISSALLASDSLDDDDGDNGGQSQTAQTRSSYKASTLKSWFEIWVRPVCDATQTCEVFRAMAEGLDSWLFVLDVAASLSSGGVPYSKRPAAEEELAASVYQFARGKLAACAQQCAQQISDQEVPSRHDPAVRVSARQANLRALFQLQPQQFAEDLDVRTYLDVRRGLGRSAVPAVDRTLFSPISSDERQLVAGGGGGGSVLTGWQFALDTFNPAECFKRSFTDAPEFAAARMEKSKTNQQWEVVVQVIHLVTPELLTDLDMARRLSTILCAVWSNHGVWSSLCADLAVKLLKAAALWSERNTESDQTPPPGQVLVNFSRGCPHELFLPPSQSKKDWIVSLLTNAVTQRVRPEEKTLSCKSRPALCNARQQLRRGSHRPHSRLGRRGHMQRERAEHLLFSQLLPTCVLPDAAKNASSSGPNTRRPDRWRSRCGCCCRASSRRGRACGRRKGALNASTAAVQSSGKSWSERVVGGDVNGFAVLTEFEGALETEAVVVAETANRRKHAWDIESSVFRRFGESGERAVAAMLESARPQDLLDLFKEFGGKEASSFLCGGPEDLLVKHWRPTECKAEDAEAMVELLVDHVPQLWSRCGQLVWEQEALEVTETHSDLMQRLLRRRVPELAMLPRRWWHAVDVATLAHHCVTTHQDQTPLQNLAQAGVRIDLAGVKGFFQDASFTLATQTLLLDLYGASDAEALAEFLPSFAGPILGYLERLLWLLDRASRAPPTDSAAASGHPPGEIY